MADQVSRAKEQLQWARELKAADFWQGTSSAATRNENLSNRQPLARLRSKHLANSD